MIDNVARVVILCDEFGDIFLVGASCEDHPRQAAAAAGKLEAE